MDTVGRSYLLPTEQPIPAAGKEVTPESVTSFVPKPQPSEGDDKLHLIKTFLRGGWCLGQVKIRQRIFYIFRVNF